MEEEELLLLQLVISIDLRLDQSHQPRDLLCGLHILGGNRNRRRTAAAAAAASATATLAAVVAAVVAVIVTYAHVTNHVDTGAQVQV